MQTGTSRATLALCAAVAASVCALTPAPSARACTADFGATGPAGASSACLCGPGGPVAAAGLVDTLAADAAGPRAAAVSAAATVPVTMAFVPAVFNYSFLPPDLTINAGDTVQWTNTDTTFHTTTSTSSEAWDSSFLSPGAQFSHTFNTVGEFTYECTLHFGMDGVIRVAAVVPEPATGALVALAGFGLAARRRRTIA